jgi:hypothetical protein
MAGVVEISSWVCEGGKVDDGSFAETCLISCLVVWRYDPSRGSAGRS